MSAIESNRKDERDDKTVGLSVQGHYFVVNKSVIESHDWILSKILSSDIPWEKSSDSGQIYLDVDPSSFRIILGILNGTFDISQDAGMLPRSDLVLLKTTARYLMLDDVHEAVCAFETGIVEEYNAMLRKKSEEYDKEITKLTKKARGLQFMAEKYNLIKDKVETLNYISVFECQARREHRPFNKCGAKFITIGSCSCSKHNGSKYLDYTIHDIDHFLVEVCEIIEIIE